METKIGNYEIGKKIGSGAFGEVYEAFNTVNQTDVAVKMEPRDCEFPQLYQEAKILRALKGSKGIPDVQHYTETDQYYVMIFELLGPSLEALFKF